MWKIWILFDKDQDGKLNFSELKDYIINMAFKDLPISDQQINELFKTIDIEGDGAVTKDEMAIFLNLLLM